MECELDMCDHGDVRVISFIMARRPPRSARSDTLFPTRRSCDLASRRSLALAPQHEVNLLPRPEEGEARLEGRPQGSGLSSSTLPAAASSHFVRSEEHTSELQSLMRISYAVFCLNKKNNFNNLHIAIPSPQYTSPHTTTTQ